MQKWKRTSRGWTRWGISGPAIYPLCQYLRQFTKLRSSTKTYCYSTFTSRRGIRSQSAVQTKRRCLKDLVESQTRITIGDLVRIDILRELAIEEEESLSSIVDPEEAMSRANTSVSGQGLSLYKRSNRVRRIGENSNKISAQVWSKNKFVGRVNDDLVRVAAILARDYRTSLVDSWEDRLYRATARQSAILTQAENTDRARVAASCECLLKAAKPFAAIYSLRSSDVGALAALRSQDLGPYTAGGPLDPRNSGQSPIRRGGERVKSSDRSSPVVAVQNAVFLVERQDRRVDFAILWDRCHSQVVTTAWPGQRQTGEVPVGLGRIQGDRGGRRHEGRGQKSLVQGRHISWRSTSERLETRGRGPAGSTWRMLLKPALHVFIYAGSEHAVGPADAL